MQINLVQTEIEEALRLYLNNRGISTSGKKVEMLFTNGRKGSGLTVNVDITESPIKTPSETYLPSIIKLGEAKTSNSEPEVDVAEPEVPTPIPVPTSSLFN